MLSKKFISARGSRSNGLPPLATASRLWVNFFRKSERFRDLPVRRRHDQHPAVKPGVNGRNNPLFEQLPQILKHGVFFVRTRAISEKELLAQVQCLSLHCRGTKPVLYRSQESIS